MRNATRCRSRTSSSSSSLSITMMSSGRTVLLEGGKTWDRVLSGREDEEAVPDGGFERRRSDRCDEGLMLSRRPPVCETPYHSGLWRDEVARQKVALDAREANARDCWLCGRCRLGRQKLVLKQAARRRPVGWVETQARADEPPERNAATVEQGRGGRLEVSLASRSRM